MNRQFKINEILFFIDQGGNITKFDNTLGKVLEK